MAIPSTNYRVTLTFTEADSRFDARPKAYTQYVAQKAMDRWEVRQ